jgi:hypothetical protein
VWERERIALVRADHAIEDARGVGDAVGEDAVVADVRKADVARPARDASVRTLEADDAGERGRDPQ